MNENLNQSPNSDISDSDKSPMKSRSVYRKIALAGWLVAVVLTVCVCSYFFLNAMGESVTIDSSHLFAGFVLLAAVFAAVGFWLYRTGHEKVELTASAKSAGRLREINEQLQQEIADRRVAEDQALLIGEKEHAAGTAKSIFLASMSHEIRTPLNAIIGFGDILSEEDLSEQQSRYVENIQGSAEDLLTIINDILDFSKIEAGKMDTEIVDCSLVSLFEGVESIMRPMAMQKGLNFAVNISQAVPGVIRTDPVRVRQCLINLVNNALKFTKEGHVYVNVSSFEGNDGKFVRFDVEDTGIGIPPGKLDSIFKSFTQADVSHTRQYGGTGLGLAITKNLAQLLGGSLKVKSEAGKGTVFTLSIPANISEMTGEVSSDDSRDKFKNIYAESKKEQISGRVLVAEDSHANQMLVKVLLERMGLEVVIAEDGKIALSKLLADSFDLVLMDIQMPNMNGYEVTAAIREKGIDVPVVALTAHAMKGDSEKCLAAGCDDYLAKPIDREKLNDIVYKYLDPKNGDEKTVCCYDCHDEEICGAMSDPKDDSNDRGEDGSTDELTVNWGHAMSFCGDEKAINRVVKSIIEDGYECINAIVNAIELDDSKQILLYAHRLRGSALTIGIEGLAEAAGKIEDAAHDGDVILAASYVEGLRCEYHRTVEFLNRDDWMEISMAASCHKGGGGEIAVDSHYDNYNNNSE